MARFTHVHDLVPAALPDVAEIAGFCVAVVPFALAALEHRIPRYVWTEESYLRGTQLVRSLQLSLICGGLKEITDRQDALYRMLDTAMFGTTYSIIESDPLEVEPVINPTHGLVIEHADSLLGRMEDSRQLQQNALNGTETPLYDRANGVRDLLEQLITALEASDDLDPDMLAKLSEIALALA